MIFSISVLGTGFLFLKTKKRQNDVVNLNSYLSAAVCLFVKENFIVDENLAAVVAGLLPEHFDQLAVGVDHPLVASVERERRGQGFFAVVLVGFVPEHRQSDFDLLIWGELRHFQLLSVSDFIILNLCFSVNRENFYNPLDLFGKNLNFRYNVNWKQSSCFLIAVSCFQKQK